MRATPGIDGIVLRYGYFYGPGTAYAPDGSMAELARRREFPIVGTGAGWFSCVHVGYLSTEQRGATNEKPDA